MRGQRRLITAPVVVAAFATAAFAMSKTGAGSTGGVGGGTAVCTHKPSGYSKVQAGYAARIVAVGRQMGISQHGQIIAVATAIQESSLHNLPGGDRDSVGLFQQRPSQGWGSWAQVHNPEHAARSFYTSLKKVPGWQHMSVTAAAQAVQRSAFPGAYAKWENDATALVACTKTSK